MFDLVEFDLFKLVEVDPLFLLQEFDLVELVEISNSGGT